MVVGGKSVNEKRGRAGGIGPLSPRATLRTPRWERPSIPTLTSAPAILLGFLVRPGWDKVGVLCLLLPMPRLWQEPPALLDARGQQWTVGVSPVPTCQAASLTLDAGWSPVNPPQAGARTRVAKPRLSPTSSIQVGKTEQPGWGDPRDWGQEVAPRDWGESSCVPGGRWELRGYEGGRVLCVAGGGASSSSYSDCNGLCGVRWGWGATEL